MKVGPGFLARLVLALTIFGYPTIGTLTSLLHLEPQALSLPYRGLVAGLSLVLLMAANRARNIYQIDRMLLVFFAIYGLRLIWDWQVQPVEGASFALLFFVLVTVLPTLAIACRAHLIHEESLTKYMLVFGLTLSMLFLTAKALGLAYNPWATHGVDIDRLMFEHLNPISIGQASGVTMLAGLAGITRYSGRSIWYLFSILAIVIGLYVVLLANSRGPIISLFVAILFISMSSIRLLLFNTVVGGTYFTIYGFQNDLVESVLARFAIVNLGTDGSTRERLELLTSGWQAFLDYPVFGAYYIDPLLGLGYYPHNLLVEAAMSLGVLGLLLFVILSIRLLLTLIYSREQATLECAMALYFFVGTMFSGSIWGSSSFFMMLALVLARKKLKVRSFHGTTIVSRQA